MNTSNRCRISASLPSSRCLKNWAALFCMTLGVSVTSLSAETRDPIKWPFSRGSIWNKPIGSNAVYVHANFPAAGRFGDDENHIILLKSTDPSREVHQNNGNWSSGRCTSSGFLRDLNFPNNYVVPDAGGGSTPNNNFAFIAANGRTVWNGNVLARCSSTGRVYCRSWTFNKSQGIYKNGIENAQGQGASQMSALGGTIRKGELTGSGPIRHALKFTMWADEFCYWSSSNKYRWPATSADGYASDSGRYRGTNPKLTMGALLALKPDLSKSSLNLETEVGEKIFHALQDYGGYIVEDSAWDKWMFITQEGVSAEVQAEYGFGLETGGGNTAFKRDMNKLITRLHIVDNNSSSNVGGGGTPRVAQAPAFKYEAEHVARSSSGASSSVVDDNDAIRDRWVVLNSNSVNDYIEFDLESVSSDNYELKIRYKAHSSRGKFQAKLGSTNIGGVKDQYSASTSYKTMTVGTINITSFGTKTIRFVVTGKNSSSSDYKLSFDQVWLEAVSGGGGGGSSSSSSSGHYMASNQQDYKLSKKWKTRTAK